jgi:A/G-specific adenine glycosylase
VSAEVGCVRHGVTRFAITLVAMEATRIRGKIDDRYYQSFAWVDPTTADEYPMATPHRKLFAEVTKRSRQKRLF